MYFLKNKNVLNIRYHTCVTSYMFSLCLCTGMCTLPQLHRSMIFLTVRYQYVIISITYPVTQKGKYSYNTYVCTACSKPGYGITDMQGNVRVAFIFV